MVLLLNVGTFGQKASWDIDKALKGARKLPHDIHRVASANTLRQLRSTAKPRWRSAVLHFDLHSLFATPMVKRTGNSP